MVEFALIFPIALIVLFGAIAGSYLFFQSEAVNNGARGGSRWATIKSENAPGYLYAIPGPTHLLREQRLHNHHCQRSATRRRTSCPGTLDACAPRLSAAPTAPPNCASRSTAARPTSMRRRQAKPGRTPMHHGLRWSTPAPTLGKPSLNRSPWKAQRHPGGLHRQYYLPGRVHPAVARRRALRTGIPDRPRRFTRRSRGLSVTMDRRD